MPSRLSQYVQPSSSSTFRPPAPTRRHDADRLSPLIFLVSQTSYHLHTQLRASPAQVLALKLQPTVRSQLFEAYLGAISEHYSFEFARAWLREVLTPVAVAGYEAFKAKADEDARPKPGDPDHQGYTAMLVSPFSPFDDRLVLSRLSNELPLALTPFLALSIRSNGARSTTLESSPSRTRYPSTRRTRRSTRSPFELRGEVSEKEEEEILDG